VAQAVNHHKLLGATHGIGQLVEVC